MPAGHAVAVVIGVALLLALQVPGSAAGQGPPHVSLDTIQTLRRGLATFREQLGLPSELRLTLDPRKDLDKALGRAALRARGGRRRLHPSTGHVSATAGVLEGRLTVGRHGTRDASSAALRLNPGAGRGVLRTYDGPAGPNRLMSGGKISYSGDGSMRISTIFASVSGYKVAMEQLDAVRRPATPRQSKQRLRDHERLGSLPLGLRTALLDGRPVYLSKLLVRRSLQPHHARPRTRRPPAKLSRNVRHRAYVGSTPYALTQEQVSLIRQHTTAAR